MQISEITYASEADGDTILGSTDPWNSASQPDKQEALEWSYVYMNNVYDIPPQGATTSNQTLKNVNALLANSHLTSNLFKKAEADAPKKGLKKKRVKAADVESESEYDPVLTGFWQDPFPELTALMSNAGFELKSSSGSGISTVSVIRR